MSTPVKDCPQTDYPIRERAYTPEQIARQGLSGLQDVFDAMFGVSGPLTKASAEADKIHAAWIAANEDDES